MKPKIKKFFVRCPNPNCRKLVRIQSGAFCPKCKAPLASVYYRKED